MTMLISASGLGRTSYVSIITLLRIALASLVLAGTGLPAQTRVQEKAIYTGDGSLAYFTSLLPEGRIFRYLMARSRKMPVEIYAALARDCEASIAAELAENPVVPGDIINQLAAYDFPDMKAVLIRRKELMPDHRRRLVRELIATLPAKDLGRFVQDPDAPAEYLDRCADDLDPNLRSNAASAAQTSLPTLQKLVNDPAGKVAASARRALQRRFPESVAETAPRLLPLEQLTMPDNPYNILQWAIKNGDLPLILKMADYREMHNQLQHDMPDLARLAIELGRTEVLDLFFSRGMGRDPVVLGRLAGSCAGDSQWLEYFRRQGALEPRAAKYALCEAAMETNPDHLRALLEAGCDPNQRGSTGDTPLHLAVRRFNLPAIKLLLAHGARSDLPAVMEKTAVDYALARMFLPALRLMDLSESQRTILDHFINGFPNATPNSPFPGVWREENDPLRGLHVTLDRDATGCYSAMRGHPPVIAWRETAPLEADLFHLDDQGEVVQQVQLHLRFNPATEEITVMHPDGTVRIMKRHLPAKAD